MRVHSYMAATASALAPSRILSGRGPVPSGSARLTPPDRLVVLEDG